ncbi:hypothetical protein GCM10010273_14430 [Streptomyces lavendulocolor]
MIGIIDSAISSRFFQLVNESSLTVTGLSFELGGAHMLTPCSFDLSLGPAPGPGGGGIRARTGATGRRFISLHPLLSTSRADGPPDGIPLRATRRAAHRAASGPAGAATRPRRTVPGYGAIS